MADHCRQYALSDKNDEDYQSECDDHVHDHLCHDCEQLNEVLDHIRQSVEESGREDYDDILFTLNHSVSHIKEC